MKMEEGKNRLLRPLGHLENYSLVRSQLQIYNNVCVAASYRRTSTEPLKPAIYRGIAAVVANHPSLSAVPAEIDGTSRFIRLEHLVLDQIISFSRSHDFHLENIITGGGLDSFLENEHNHPFSHTTPLRPFWRVRVLAVPDDTSFVLIFCFHHSLADTKSALVFLEDLELALSDPTARETPLVVPPCNLQLLPPLEALTELPISHEFIHAQQNLGEPPSELWTGGAQAWPCITRFASLSLCRATTLDFMTKCKLNEASITSGIMSLISSALFTAIPSNFSTLQGDCAVSLRPLLPLPITSRSMGCFVGSFSQIYQRDCGSLWDKAKWTKTTTEKALARRGEDMPVAYLKHVPSLTQWFKSKIGKKRWASFELSNVGTLSSPQSSQASSYQIEDVIFSQSASACSGALKVSAVSGRSGNLVLGFSWQQGVVDDAIVKQVMADMKREVEDM